MSEELTVNDVMAQRFELEERISIIQGQQKAALAPLVEARDACEVYIKDVMLKQGLQNLKTDAGMALFVSQDRAGVADFDLFTAGLVTSVQPPASLEFTSEEWAQVVTHIAKNANWSLLNKVVNKTAAKEYIEVHNQPPPGVKFESYKDLNWRRGKG